MTGSSSIPPHPRGGFTLVEILVALAVTLILMLAAVTLFSTVGNAIRSSTRDIERSQRLRHAADLLNQDLAGLTISPNQIPGMGVGGKGYLEIQEGADRDPDSDDCLLLTSNSQNPRFTGLFGQDVVVLPGSGDPVPTTTTGGGTTTGGTTTGGTTTTTTTTTTGGTTGGGCSGYAQTLDDLSGVFSGSWSTNTTTTPRYGTQYRFAAAGGSNTATFQFTGLVPGAQYKVFATWLEASNRATNAPFTISGGASPDTVPVNQVSAPASDTTDGGRPFKLVTTVTPTGTTVTVSVTTAGANNFIIIDAVRIECDPAGGTTTGGTTTGTTSGGTTTGTSTTGTSTTGTTTSSTATTSTTGGTPTTQISTSVESRSNSAEIMWFVHNGTLYRRAVPIVPRATIPQMPINDLLANYDISATNVAANTWRANSLDNLEQRSNREARAGASHLYSKTQMVSGLQNVDRLGAFAVLDHVQSFDIQVWDPGAPIVLVQSVGGGTAGSGGTTTTGGTTSGGTTTGGSSTTGGSCGNYTQTLDDQAGAFSGSWTTNTTTTPRYGSQYRFAASGGSNTATFEFTGLVPGAQYKVFATWLEASNRATNAPFTISGGASPVTVPVNQVSAPASDTTDGGRPFNLVTTVTPIGTTVTVSVTTATANNFVIVDAVRIECSP